MSEEKITTNNKNKTKQKNMGGAMQAICLEWPRVKQKNTGRYGEVQN